MNRALELRPTYWASVSGGKDSLYMLNLILHNLDKYPLNGVVHFELEIDFPFIKDVIDYMESECKKFGIPFLRIKPTHTWKELYDKRGYPGHTSRWCTGEYKLDCGKQLKQMLKNQGYMCYVYIGYCVDETKRYEKRNFPNERYQLVEEGIYESEILEWAKQVPQFNDYYKYNRRCGCMGCPMTSLPSWAYLYKYYPEQYNYFMSLIKETELERHYLPLGKHSSYVEDIIKTKYIPRMFPEAKPLFNMK